LLRRPGRPSATVRAHTQTDRPPGRIHQDPCTLLSWRGSRSAEHGIGHGRGDDIRRLDGFLFFLRPSPHAKRVPWTGGATIRITSPRNGSTSNRLVTSLLCLLYVDRILNAYRVLQLELVRMSAVYDDKIENPSSSPVPAK